MAFPIDFVHADAFEQEVHYPGADFEDDAAAPMFVVANHYSQHGGFMIEIALGFEVSDVYVLFLVKPTWCR